MSDGGKYEKEKRMQLVDVVIYWDEEGDGKEIVKSLNLFRCLLGI